jgi:hypothetical protein
MRYFKSNTQETTLTSTINSTDVIIAVASVTNYPTVPFTLVIDPDLATQEIVEVTAISGLNLTVTRNIENTGAIGHDAGAKVQHMITGRDLQQPQEHMAATSSVHGVTGDLVGATQTQTLTNKSLTSPTITGSGTIAASSVSAASVTATSSATLPATTSIGSVSNTEISYLDGVTSAIQTQLNTLSAAATPIWYRRTAATSSITTTATAMFATSPTLDANSWYYFQFFARVPFSYTGTAGALSFTTGFSETVQTFNASSSNTASNNTTFAANISPVTSTTVSPSTTGSTENILVMEGFFQTHSTLGSTFTPRISVNNGSVTVAAGSHIQILKLPNSSASINGTWS